MSEVPPRPGSEPRSRVLAPSVILLLGLATLAACLLLLFGPFYPEYRGPAQLLQSRLLLLLGPDGPRALRQLALYQFVPVVVAVLAVALVLVPWRTAAGRQRRPSGASAQGRPTRGLAGGSAGAGVSIARVRRAERTAAVAFADDGGITGGDDAGVLRHSVPALRLMARAAGVPWHTDYETEGGARAFLEVLRALHAGPVEVRRGDEADAAVRPSSAATAMSAAAAEAAVAEAAPASDPGGRPGDDARQGWPNTDSSWLSSSLGSVYTPTTLYRPTSLGAQDEATDEEER